MTSLLIKYFSKSSLIVLLTISMVQAQIDNKSQPPNQKPQGQQANTSNETRTGTRIRGSVTTDGGRPVPDAAIFIFPVNIVGNVQGTVTSMLRPNTSDADGKFELTSL